MNRKKPNRFSPIGPLLDAIAISLVFTFARSLGITGKYTPMASPTADFNILIPWFLEGLIYIFIIQYFLCIVGMMPANGILLKLYREYKDFKQSRPPKRKPWEGSNKGSGNMSSKE
jgi:hypothetical protein